MKKFKKKPKSIKRSHQKTILKRPLWLAPLLISGFVSGVYANNLWDLLNPKVGGEYVHWVKGSQYCAWWEFAGCLKNVWGANHKGTTNATNTAFSNASGSFTFEENATFSGAKLNGGAFIFNKDFSATNNTAFNSGNFNFKGASSFNGANFSNTGKITIEKEASFSDTTFNTYIII